jgi:hypothetical protein
MEQGRTNPFTAPDPNRVDKPPQQTPQAQATLAVPSLFGAFALLPLLALFLFHLGAGYLSYQKYGSIGWASLDFLFAYFYYPYYAFFLAKDPGPMAQTTMLGGKRGVFGALKKLLK